MLRMLQAQQDRLVPPAANAQPALPTATHSTRRFCAASRSARSLRSRSAAASRSAFAAASRSFRRASRSAFSAASASRSSARRFSRSAASFSCCAQHGNLERGRHEAYGVGVHCVQHAHRVQLWSAVHRSP